MRATDSSLMARVFTSAAAAMWATVSSRHASDSLGALQGIRV